MSRRARPIPHTAESVAFPLGGIGTGNVSLGARGELRDWEFENLPDKGRLNPRSFFAIHAAPQGGPAVTRVLEARSDGRHDRDAGYGFDELAGLPRLDSADLHGEYPVVDIDFTDATLPVTVHLGSEIHADSLELEGADAIVVATGSLPIVPRSIPGIDGDNVVEVLDFHLGTPVGQRVVVAGGGAVVVVNVGVPP